MPASTIHRTLLTMMTLKTVRRMQDARRPVQLDDGRIGKIVRVDTTFPGNHTEVSVYTLGEGPGIAKVTLDRLFETRSRSIPAPEMAFDQRPTKD